MSEVNVTFDLPELPDNDVWWANSAAWQAYWNESSLVVSIDPATTTDYGVIKVANTLPYTSLATTNNDASVLVVDGVNYMVPTLESYQQLKAAFNALNLNYQNLKSALITAGTVTL